MKVIQITPEGNIGSVGTIAEEIGKKLVEKNIYSYIAYAQFDKPSISVKYKIGNAINRYIHALETRLFDNNGLSSRISTFLLINWIKKISPDIIHIHQLHGYYINYRILFNFLNNSSIPIVLTLHDCWLFTGHCTYFESINCNKWKSHCQNCDLYRDYPKSLIIDRSKYNFELKKSLFTSNKNIYLTSVSHWLASKVSESILRHLPNQVIYNGIDISIFKSKTENCISPFKDSIFRNKFIIIGVASPWDDRKGLNDFIELSHYLKENQLIVLIGVTEKQKKILPNNVIGIAPVFNKFELANYYKFSNIFINFSKAETFGLTTVEAMACGIPAIVYNNTAFPEIVKHGETGYLINQKNFEEILELINKIENTSENKLLHDNCVRHVNENFNSLKKYNEYVDLYSKIYQTNVNKKKL